MFGSSESAQQLSVLRFDARHSQLLERVNDVLDAIEHGPRDRSVRRRAYGQPPRHISGREIAPGSATRLRNSRQREVALSRVVIGSQLVV